MVLLGLSAAAAWAGPLFRTNDTVALIGGASVVAVDRAGLVETAVLLAHPGCRLRFRALAWEGDSVFARPRDPNFPSLTHLLQHSTATAACLEFGALEALDRSVTVDSFRAGYRRVLEEVRAVCPRVVVVLPPPFEIKAAPLPDLTSGNVALADLARTARALAEESQLPVVDLQRAWAVENPARAWTHDGRELTMAGHQALAAAWARELGWPGLADRLRAAGFWKRPEIEALTDAIHDRSRLWFDYWRPMNWAFLAGDRTEQQASRDHRDPKIRWFPAEMEEYLPLIAEADLRIESLAAQVHLVP